ncbi:ankyrin repeat domain-containing protein [Baaleninema simplex]|uniref:ankyrin repeat domain-containing protein n=1 Tax=Baaleninema simplex TaxID=2862350 RepID=UPI000349C9DD|nr:ankyrin repeat domain-containing protein [Baaleninema simplex]
MNDLRKTIESQNIDRLKALIQQEIDLDEPFEDGDTALTLAARLGNKPMVRALVKAGANVNLRTESGETALQLAANAGHRAICEYLNILSEPSERDRAREILDRVAPPEPSPQEKINALVAAAKNGDLETVRSLIDRNVNLDGTSTEVVNKTQTALYVAARDGHLDIVRQLIEAGANLNCVVERDDRWTGVERNCPKCETAFTSIQNYGKCPNCGHEFYASLADRDRNSPESNIFESAIVREPEPGIRITTIPPKAIRERSSPPRLEAVWSHYTPLMVAVRTHQTNIARLLVEAGASLESSNTYDRSPLHNAVETGQRELVRCFIEAGAVLDRFEGSMADDKTPLMLAVERRDLETIELLLNGGANPNAKSQYGDTALTRAAEIGDRAIVERLQAAGASHDGLDVIELCIAAEQGDLDRLQRLLAAGVDPNRADFRRRTALAQAAGSGQVEAMRVLLEAGADVNGSDRYHIPIRAAKYYGHTEAVKLLLKAGAVNVPGAFLDRAESYLWGDIMRKTSQTLAMRTNSEIDSNRRREPCR